MRIGVIGAAGNMGQRHAATLRALGETTLALYDARCNWRSHYGWQPDTLDDLWAWKPDAVLVCTPPENHLTAIEQAREAGVRGIFCEKPLALHRPYPGWVDKLADCATMVGCNLRYHAGPRAVKAWLPAIGKPLLATARHCYYLPATREDWRTCYAASTGALLDVGTHITDLLLDWFGPAELGESWVYPAEPLGLDTDGAAHLTLRHADLTSRLYVSFMQEAYEQSVTIVGECGVVGYSWADGRASMYADNQPEQVVTWDADEPARMFSRELADFTECVREGRQTVNPVARAAATLGLLLEARR